MAVRPLLLLPPAIFAALAGLFAAGMLREDPSALPSARKGQPAPPVVLEALGPEPLFDDTTLREDGVKLVNYWASWCAPCRIEHPIMLEIAASGVPLYGVNYKDEEENALGFLAELGNPYTAVGADVNGRMGLDWGLYGVPETYVIDAEGTIRLRFAGPITREIYNKRILPAIEAARGP